MLHPPEPKTTEERIIEMYACMQAIQSQLAAIDKRIGAMCDNCEAEDKRLGELEEWRSTVRGGLTTLSVVGGLAGAVGGLIVKIFNP
ncbi:MAG: hypothetical protein M0Z94_00880 [Dehalococcoidales bacterium]|nr:hypothetical protein [Dehalococcoidales bacterium]